jgi:O-antigen/teichoic acid export membrane protein
MSMSLRQLAKDIAIYGTGDVLLRATAFVTMPVYTRIFAVEDYGMLNFVLTVTGFLSAVLFLGGDSAYARFFFEAKDQEQRQLITSSWFGFLAIWSGGVILLCLPFVGLFSRWSFGTADQAALFALALLTAPLTLINQLCGQALRNQFRAQLFTVLNVLATLLTIGLAFFAVVGLNLGLVGVLAGTLAATVLILPVRLWTIRNMLRPVFSVQIVRRMLAFGLPFVPASFAVWIFASSDRLVLGRLSSLDQLGLFAVATSVASLLVLVNGAIGQAWSPHAIRVYEDHPEQARVFYGQVLTYILIGFGVLTVGVTAFADVLLKVLAAPEFYAAARAVGPLALGTMAYASIHVTAIGISLMKQTKYLAIFCWVAAVINLTLNLMLVPRWGMMASSWATALTYLFLTIGYLSISQRLWPVTYEKRRSLSVAGLTAVFTIVAMYLPDLPLVEGVALKGVYCMLFVASLILARAIDRREWLALASLLPHRAATANIAT